MELDFPLRRSLTLLNPSRKTITAETTYFVRPDGNDLNDGLADNPYSAFSTLMKASKLIQQIDGNGYNVKIRIKDGTYNISQEVIFSNLIGVQTLVLEGNTATPQSVIIQGVVGVTGGWGMLRFIGVNADISGFRLTNTQPNGIGIGVENGSKVITRNNQYAQFGNCALLVRHFGDHEQIGGMSISGSCQQFLSVAGHSVSSWFEPGVGTIFGNPNFSLRFLRLEQSIIRWIPSNFIWSGSATGVRHVAESYSLIEQYTQAGQFPGSIAGTVSNSIRNAP